MGNNTYLPLHDSISDSIWLYHIPTSAQTPELWGHIHSVLKNSVSLNTSGQETKTRLPDTNEYKIFQSRVQYLRSGSLARAHSRGLDNVNH